MAGTVQRAKAAAPAGGLCAAALPSGAAEGRACSGHLEPPPGAGTGDSCRWRGTSVHPIPTILMPLPARDAQILERDCRSAGEHLKSSTEEFQPLQPSVCLEGLAAAQRAWYHPSPVCTAATARSKRRKCWHNRLVSGLDPQSPISGRWLHNTRLRRGEMQGREAGDKYYKFHASYLGWDFPKYRLDNEVLTYAECNSFDATSEEL
ncbi:uncharacterized protein LOC130142561 isoform X1 [Falco biarmicus]|uniref:uncharacterized protein LOC130142561 isoform X1 n=1 Tax=Falco biarmicus TaxID=345155 RepID=UPI0024BD3670|nr:uncharacterized protein LOC130142561 isoform X1 [Falco biarmicus]